MSYTLTSIAQMALTDVRADPRINDIDDLTDTSAEATACRLYIDNVIGGIFEDFDWRWASRVQTLALHVDSPSPGYTYRYQLPSDCLVPRELLFESRARNMDPVPFEIELSANGYEQTLLCNAGEAKLRYTTNLYSNTVSAWPSRFMDAVRFKLATELASALKKEPKLAESMFQRHQLAIEQAKYVNNESRQPGPMQTPSSLRSRTGVAVENYPEVL